MFCVDCGKKVGEGYAFCPFCGAKVFDVSELPEEETVPVVKVQQGSLRKEEPVAAISNESIKENGMKPESEKVAINQSQENAASQSNPENISIEKSSSESVDASQTQSMPVPPKFEPNKQESLKQEPPKQEPPKQEPPKPKDKKKIVIIAVCAVVVLCLGVFAVFGSRSSTSSSTLSVSENDKISSTDIKTNTFQETELYNQDDIVITFEGIEDGDSDSYGGYSSFDEDNENWRSIKIKVENNSEKDIHLSLYSLFVDDCLMQESNFLDSGKVTAGKNLNVEISLLDSDLINNNVDTISKLTFNFKIYDEEYENIGEVTKEVYSTNGKNFTVNKNDDGETILNDYDSKIVYKGATEIKSDESYGYCGYLTFYVENNSSDELEYNLDDTSINGTMTYINDLGTFLPSTSGVIRIGISNSDLEEIGVSSFSELKDCEFEICIRSAEDYDRLFTSDTISITINENAKSSTTKTDKTTSVNGVTLDKQEVYNSQGITMEVTGMEEDDYSVEINFTVTNNSESDVEILGYCYINGCYITVYSSTGVKAGKKGSDSVLIFKSELESAEIEKISQIRFYGKLLDEDDYDQIDTFDSTVYTSLGKDYKQEDVTDGKEVYNQNNITVLMRGVSSDGQEDTLNYYVKNNSDKKCDVELTIKSINGVDVSDEYLSSYATLLPNTNGICMIQLDDYYYEKLPISSIDEITEMVIEIEIMDYDSYNYIDETTFTVTKDDIDKYTK